VERWAGWTGGQGRWVGRIGFGPLPPTSTPKPPTPAPSSQRCLSWCWESCRYPRTVCHDSGTLPQYPLVPSDTLLGYLLLPANSCVPRWNRVTGCLQSVTPVACSRSHDHPITAIGWCQWWCLSTPNGVHGCRWFRVTGCAQPVGGYRLPAAGNEVGPATSPEAVARLLHPRSPELPIAIGNGAKRGSRQCTPPNRSGPNTPPQAHQVGR
jgi:hypothetical protein